MASTQGQDVVLCQLCTNPVEHHCNLCRVDLCSPCILKHLADKTNRHEIVEFINRKEGPVLPECDTHKKNRCEMYCRECCKPTCALCVTTSHKKHDITDIGEIIENKKQQIFADMTELENFIVPKYRNFTPAFPSAEFDKAITAIQDQEDRICNLARGIGSKLRDEVTQQKRKSEQEYKEFQTLAMETEIELNKIIQNNNEVIKAGDATAIMSYKSRNEKFRDGMKKSDLSCPNFVPVLVKENQILDMFGKLQLKNSNVSDKQQSVLQLMETPVTLKEIQSPYGNKSELWRITCEGTGKLWVSGNNGTINQIDWDGSILKTINLSKNAVGLSLNVQQEIVFIKGWEDTKVFKYKNNNVVTLLELSNWRPRGLCHTINGNLLISMRSLDEAQSRVVRYSGSTECQVIMNDKRGKPLFSVHSRTVLHLIENGNGDICVADYAGNAVVVVNSSGILRFRYGGNKITKKKNKTFEPLNIVNDKQCHILIHNQLNNNVHIIDCDGNFIRYIKYPCNGGISVDTDHNLVVGESVTGKIRITKYLE
ncbi:uncharacterized protein LOC128173820 [Crassostrea angulata]|uniref:uncharacterized protein LOC128173820 n=1 Tax=Magallana angulata TaxID=2784310 RepID=UPI0022B1FFBE|nr:uncharacterized protein LOC128173820 [Crassostrea angulata]XP_052695451.1 uncharacterized protein LOC128173820 [Crassostrea angulata]